MPDRGKDVKDRGKTVCQGQGQALSLTYGLAMNILAPDCWENPFSFPGVTVLFIEDVST
jgi:hypothetical protein